MTTFLALALAAQVAAAVVAILLARRRVEHRPAAVALALLATANLLDRMAAERNVSREAMLDVLTELGAAREEARVDALAAEWGLTREETIRVLGDIARSAADNDGPARK
jgi:hypothetical protein